MHVRVEWCGVRESVQVTMQVTVQVTMLVHLLITVATRPCQADKNLKDPDSNEQLFHKVFNKNQTVSKTIQSSDEITVVPLKSSEETGVLVQNSSTESLLDILNDTLHTYNHSDVIITNSQSNLSINVASTQIPSMITKLELGSQTYVIVMLSAVVLFAILFTMFGLFMKAEAHSKAQPHYHNALMDNHYSNQFPMSATIGYVDE